MAEIALHPFPSLDMEKSNERTVDGEKDKHMDHREHQIGMDTGVKGTKGCITLLWARGESMQEGWKMT